jgi:hypothetical protein
MRITGAKKKWTIKLLLKDGFADEEIMIGQLWECADYFLFSPKMLWEWCRTIIEDTREDVLEKIKCHYHYRLSRCEGINKQMYFSLSDVERVF